MAEAPPALNPYPLTGAIQLRSISTMRARNGDAAFHSRSSVRNSFSSPASILNSSPRSVPACNSCSRQARVSRWNWRSRRHDVASVRMPTISTGHSEAGLFRSECPDGVSGSLCPIWLAILKRAQPPRRDIDHRHAPVCGVGVRVLGNPVAPRLRIHVFVS